MPELLGMGAVVVVRVPHINPPDELIRRAFRARSPDGREFSIDVVKVKPDSSPGTTPTSTMSGYLRPAHVAG